jgi:hypothetical protein
MDNVRGPSECGVLPKHCREETATKHLQGEPMQADLDFNTFSAKKIRDVTQMIDKTGAPVTLDVVKNKKDIIGTAWAVEDHELSVALKH